MKSSSGPRAEREHQITSMNIAADRPHARACGFVSSFLVEYYLQGTAHNKHRTGLDINSTARGLRENLSTLLIYQQ